MGERKRSSTLFTESGPSRSSRTRRRAFTLFTEVPSRSPKSPKRVPMFVERISNCDVACFCPRSSGDRSVKSGPWFARSKSGLDARDDIATFLTEEELNNRKRRKAEKAAVGQQLTRQRSRLVRSKLGRQLVRQRSRRVIERIGPQFRCE